MSNKYYESLLESLEYQQSLKRSITVQAQAPKPNHLPPRPSRAEWFKDIDKRWEENLKANGNDSTKALEALKAELQNIYTTDEGKTTATQWLNNKQQELNKQVSQGESSEQGVVTTKESELLSILEAQPVSPKDYVRWIDNYIVKVYPDAQRYLQTAQSNPTPDNVSAFIYEVEALIAHVLNNQSLWTKLKNMGADLHHLFSEGGAIKRYNSSGKVTLRPYIAQLYKLPYQGVATNNANPAQQNFNARLPNQPGQTQNAQQFPKQKLQTVTIGALSEGKAPTLSQAAQMAYGKGWAKYWPLIATENKIINPRGIALGTTLKVPPLRALNQAEKQMLATEAARSHKPKTKQQPVQQKTPQQSNKSMQQTTQQQAPVGNQKPKVDTQTLADQVGKIVTNPRSTPEQKENAATQLQNRMKAVGQKGSIPFYLEHIQKGVAGKPQEGHEVGGALDPDEADAHGYKMLKQLGGGSGLEELIAAYKKLPLKSNEQYAADESALTQLTGYFKNAKMTEEVKLISRLTMIVSNRMKQLKGQNSFPVDNASDQWQKDHSGTPNYQNPLGR